MFERLFGKMKPAFVNTFADHVRSQQAEQLDRIEVPSDKLKDEQFIARLFVTHGRIVKSIDTTTFRNKTVVVTTDLEVWSARINLAEQMSMFVIRLTTAEMEELQQA